MDAQEGLHERRLPVGYGVSRPRTPHSCRCLAQDLWLCCPHPLHEITQRERRWSRPSASSERYIRGGVCAAQRWLYCLDVHNRCSLASLSYVACVTQRNAGTRNFTLFQPDILWSHAGCQRTSGSSFHLLITNEEIGSYISPPAVRWGGVSRQMVLVYKVEVMPESILHYFFPQYYGGFFCTRVWVKPLCLLACEPVGPPLSYIFRPHLRRPDRARLFPVRPLHEALQSVTQETLSPSPSGPPGPHLYLTNGPGHNLIDDFIVEMMSWEICSSLYSFTSHPWCSPFPEQRVGPLPH